MAAREMASEIAPLRVYRAEVHAGYVNVTYGIKENPAPEDVTHMAFLLRENVPKKQGRSFAMPCQPYCGLNLHRFHVTCVTCPIRRIRAGKMPQRFPVRVKWLTVHQQYTGVGRVKTALLKRILSLLSMLQS